MEVTQQQLEDALTEFRTAVRPDGGRAGDVQPGWIAFPPEMAETIFATLDRMAALREDGQDVEPDDGPCEFIRDPELAAMAAIMAAIDALESCEPSTTSRSVFGVLAYIAHRYGFTLTAGEDGNR